MGKLLADIGIITFETLKNLVSLMMKFSYSFLIDDLAISAYSNLDKELGYYNNKIKRDFNTIQTIL